MSLDVPLKLEENNLKEMPKKRHQAPAQGNLMPGGGLSKKPVKGFFFEPPVPRSSVWCVPGFRYLQIMKVTTPPWPMF